MTQWRFKPLAFLQRQRGAPVSQGFMIEPHVDRIPSLAPHDDLARLHQLMYMQTASHNMGIASSRLPVTEAQNWYKKVTSAFGTRYINNAGGKKGVPYDTSILPLPYATQIVGRAALTPHNTGSVGYQDASSGITELYGLAYPGLTEQQG